MNMDEKFLTILENEIQQYGQVGFISEMKVLFSIWKSSNYNSP